MTINKYLNQSGDATVPQGKSQKELCNKPFFNDIWLQLNYENTQQQSVVNYIIIFSCYKNQFVQRLHIYISSFENL